MIKKNILLYGGTGSIGDAVLNVIRRSKDEFSLCGITCDKNISKLKNIVDEFKPVSIGIGQKCAIEDASDLFNDCNLFQGIDEFNEMLAPDIDIVILAISGLDCLKLSLDIAKSGKIFGIANKESIISLGDLLIRTCSENNTSVVPLDSEHNSIYQIIKGHSLGINSITLTASGGPFLKKPLSDLQFVSPDEAVKHPKWSMGKKISVDSANMMNKSLELIEAKFLFQLDYKRINAIIHPQALIHGMVEYNDRSLIAFLSYPTMEVPISNLFYPDKSIKLDDYKVDLITSSPLEFIEIDRNRFPSIVLAKNVMEISGIAPHCFNYINEKLVHLFLDNKITFLDIINLNSSILEQYFKINQNINVLSINDINESNAWLDEYINANIIKKN